MSWFSNARVLAVISLAGLAVCAPSASTLARAKKAPVIEAPPPPPPPADPVSLPARTLADAAAFQALIERVGGASPAFADGSAVSRTLHQAAAFEPRALIRDAVAYGAVAALQNPTFVAELRKAGDSPENRRLMVGYLLTDPRYALLFKGSDGAAGLARQAISQAGLSLYGAGKAIRQASYDIQHQAWSKEDIADRPSRLAAIEAEGRQPPPDAADHVEALQRAATGAQPLPITATSLAPPYTPLVARAIQIAAIGALGEATDDLYDRLADVATDESTSDCLHIAKLNLYQCLAVARPHYEDMFCTGQHAMMDTGACIVANTGLPLPIDPPALGPLVGFKAISPARSRVVRRHKG